MKGCDAFNPAMERTGDMLFCSQGSNSVSALVIQVEPHEVTRIKIGQDNLAPILGY